MNFKAGILAVDDSPVSLRLLTGILTTEGYEVTPVDSGEEALAAVAKHPPDLILLDIRLSGIDGYEVCRRLSAAEETRSIPIILISAVVEVTEWAEGLRLGAVDYISKPIHREELLARVNTHLALSRTTMQLKAELDERRRAEVALQQRERKYRSLFANMIDGCALHTIITDSAGAAVDYITLEVNQTYETLLMVKADDVVGQKASQILPAVELRKWLGIFGPVALSGTTVRYEMESPLNRKWFAGTAFSPGEGLFVTTFADVTDRKQAEDILRKSDERHRVILETAMDGFWLTDTQGRIIEVNEAYCRMSGYDRKDLLTMCITDLEAAEKPTDTSAHMQKITHEGLDRFESRHRRKDGSSFDVEISVTYQPIEGGKVICFLRDITERKKVEAALRESDAQLRLALNSGRAIAWVGELHGDKVTEIGPVAELFGKPAGYTHLNRDSFIKDIHPDDQRLVIAALEEGSSGGSDRYSVEFRVLFPNSEIRWLQASGNYEKVGLGQPTLVRGLTRDITDLKRAEEERQKLEQQLNQAQKLESLSVLAGGIAHDFNNFLAGIFGYIDMARESAPETSKTASYLTKAFKTFARAKDLTEQLLTFSKGGMPVKKTGHIGPLLRENTQFALSGANVAAQFDIAEDLRPCDFDENQMGQVIDNIVINATQAMPRGGTISVAAVNTRLAMGDVGSLKDGDYLWVSFTDTGVGIPAEILPRIFDPFFTTKKKGNGLGLSTVYSILKKHDGDITVESVPGKGTTFHIYLPAAEKVIIPDNVEKIHSHAGSGCVLIMDDEESIRETLGDMIDKLGYQVAYASNGRDALTMIREADEMRKPFVAVFMDLTIPGSMGGKEAVELLRRTERELKVFVSSGYSDDPILANPAAYGFTDRIRKPFTKADLTELFFRHFGAGE
jgi:PAS domain S-box-containing protein